MKQNKKRSKLMYKIKKQFRQQREKRFVAHWSVTQSKTSYDALADKHASYYFGTNGVRKHLKKLKKVINNQPLNKQAQKIVQLLESKIGNKAKDNKDRSLQKSRQQIEAYTKQLKSGSLEKLNKTKYNMNFNKLNQRRQRDQRLQKSNLQDLKIRQVAHSKPEIQTSKLPNISVHLKNHKRALNSSQNRAVEHQEFLQFLNKRKQKLIKQQTQSRQSKRQMQQKQQFIQKNQDQQVRQAKQSKKIQLDN